MASLAPAPERGWGLELPYSVVCRGGGGCDHVSNASAAATTIRSIDVVIAAQSRPVARLVRALGTEFPRQRLESVTFWVCAACLSSHPKLLVRHVLCACAHIY